MAKASAKKTAKATATNTDIVATAHDPFNGFVFLKSDGKKFWAEHERKSITSDKGTRKAAQAAFDSYVSDTQF